MQSHEPDPAEVYDTVSRKFALSGLQRVALDESVVVEQALHAAARRDWMEVRRLLVLAGII